MLFFFTWFLVVSDRNILTFPKCVNFVTNSYFEQNFQTTFFWTNPTYLDFLVVYDRTILKFPKCINFGTKSTHFEPNLKVSYSTYFEIFFQSAFIWPITTHFFFHSPKFNLF